MFRYTTDLLTENPSKSDEKFIIALDIGTTSVRSFIYNSEYEVVGKARFFVDLIYSEESHVEIDAEIFYQNIVRVIKDSLEGEFFDDTFNYLNGSSLDFRRPHHTPRCSMSGDLQSAIDLHNLG
jgi:hypothetical protein